MSPSLAVLLIAVTLMAFVSAWAMCLLDRSQGSLLRAVEASRDAEHDWAVSRGELIAWQADRIAALEEMVEDAPPPTYPPV